MSDRHSRPGHEPFARFGGAGYRMPRMGKAAFGNGAWRRRPAALLRRETSKEAIRWRETVDVALTSTFLEAPAA